jgi:predicted nuclease with TOPRIM domain
METIEEVQTMKTIKGTKQELVNIYNGLHGVQDLKGKKFSLVVSKNISLIQEALKDLEKAGKPSKEFLAIAEQVNSIASSMPEEEAKEKIEAIEKENEKLVEARRKQMAKVEKMMLKNTELDLQIISEDFLPEDITAKQLNQIIKIIE